jgi:hypothetical protein
MRKLLSIAAAGLLTLGVAGSSSAAILGFAGSLEVQVATLDPIGITGVGAATVNGSGGLGHLDSFDIAAGVFAGGQFLEITDPAASPIAALSANVSNGSGAFSAAGTGSTSGIFGGQMGIPGSAIVCLFTSTCTGGAIVVPFTVNGTKGVGLGGSPTPHVTVGAAIAISVTGAGWTVNAAGAQSGPIDGPFTTQFQTGFAHGPASGGLSSAANNSGVISLVTPVQVNTNIGPSGSLPVFGRLTLHFVPEPGTLLLIGSGIAGLAMLGRKRMRK